MDTDITRNSVHFLWWEEEAMYMCATVMCYSLFPHYILTTYYGDRPKDSVLYESILLTLNTLG
jgi:hypothetical protein